jgi:3'-phosphoadenosine 5'-phosphosulfate sulfotransferase (PAPS reductase)/FAD synthetase
MATKPGHHYGGKPIAPAAYAALRGMQELTLDDKIQHALNAIRCWHEAWDGLVYILYSGGADSTVLRWLVHQVAPEVPAVFCHTGLEYPEVLRHVAKTPNVVTVRPKIPFTEVIKRHGWPLVSKRVARGISILRHPTDKNANITKLYDEGINRFGETAARFRTPDRWRFLIDAPFETSDRCCDIMKKEPSRRYQRMTGRMPFLGLLASDSQAREKSFLQHGCNAYDMKSPRSMPMAIWTKQDVWACIKRHNIAIPEVYGEIVEEGGQFRTTGVDGTGCVFCAFGLQMESEPTRFHQLYRSHPKLWTYCMDRLGLGEVLEYCRDHVPARLAGRFDPRPVSTQGSLLEVAHAS